MLRLGQEIDDLFKCELTDDPLDVFSMLDTLPHKLYEYQYNLLGTIVEELDKADDGILLRMNNYGANAVGKTYFLSVLACFHLMHYGLERPTETYGGIITSGSETQMRDTIMKELRFVLHNSTFGNYIDMTDRAIFLRGQKNTKFLSFRVCNSSNVDSFAGIHAQNTLVIFDEASAILPKAFEISESYFADGQRGLFYCAGNTTNPVGVFADNYLKKDDPVPVSSKQAIYHYQITRFDVGGKDDPYAHRVAARYGTDSRVYKERVLAQFVFDSSLRFISIYAINEAIERGRQLGRFIYEPREDIRIGVDIATNFAECETIATVRDEVATISMQTCPVSRNQIAMWVIEQVALHYANKSTITIFIDIIGVGFGIDAQIRSILAQKKYRKIFKAKVKVIGVMVSNKPTALRGCKNKKAECYVEFRSWLETSGALLPMEDLDKLVDEIKDIEQVADSEAIRIAPAKKPSDRISSLILTFANIHEAKHNFDAFL